MILALFFASISIALPPLIFLLAWILSSRNFKLAEKLSPYECGFDPKNSARTPFSLRFFLLAVIFLVFDVEIVLIIALPLTLFSSLSEPITAMLFLVILLLGLLHETREGSLTWST